MSECEIDKFRNKRWFLNGKIHREDGPAVVWADGSKFWFIDDKRHRDDGPAIEWPDGTKEWFLNNKEYTKDEFIILQFPKGITINE